METAGDVKDFIAQTVERLKAHCRTPEHLAKAAEREENIKKIKALGDRNAQIERVREDEHRRKLRNKRDWDEQRQRRHDGFFRMRPTQGDPVTRRWLQNYVHSVVPDADIRNIPQSWGREAIAYGVDVIRHRLEQKRSVPMEKRFDLMMSMANYYRSSKKTCWGTWQDAQDRPEAVLPWRRDIDDAYPEDEIPPEPYRSPESVSWRKKEARALCTASRSDPRSDKATLRKSNERRYRM